MARRAKTKISFGMKSGVGRTGGKNAFNQIMLDAINDALQNVTAKQIQAGYDKMTENWNDHPQFKFRVVSVHLGTQIFWSLEGNGTNNVNLKWAMVDELGRKGGKTILAGQKVVEKGYTYIPSAGQTTGKKLKKGKMSMEASDYEAYDKKQMVGRETRRQAMPIRSYSPSTKWPFKFGGPKMYGEFVALRASVKQGAVIARGLTSAHVITALRGQGSDLSGIIKPIVGRRNRYENPLYWAYYTATKAIGKGILQSVSEEAKPWDWKAEAKALYEKKINNL